MNKYFELTTQQKNIWNTEMFYSGTDMHNIGGYVLIEEPIDFNILVKSANIFVQKNDIVRSHFIIDDGTPKQYISEFKSFQVNIDKVNNYDELDKLTADTVHIPFKIINSDLYRFRLFEFPDGTGGIIPVFHHLISDAWSLGLFITEVMNTYSALIHSEEYELEPPQYIDYIVSSNEYLNSKKFNKDKDFWDTSFSSPPDLTFISKEKTQVSILGKREVCEINKTLFDKIQEYCTNNHCSTYTFFMAIFSLYLAKINSSNSSIIGTPVLNRGNFREKQTMGMFVSTVPFKVEIDYNLDFTSFVKEVGLNQSGIFRHQKYPYLTLLKDLKDKYNLNDNLFDFVLSYQNARDNKNTCKTPYRSFWCPTSSVSTPIEAHFYDMDNTGKPSIYYNYQTEKFNKQDILNIHDRIMSMVKCALKNPQIKDIPVITEKEREFIGKYNNTDYKYDKNKSLITIFEEQVKNNSDKPCVVFENKAYTYKELDEKSNKLANMLIDYNIKRNDVVGIMLNRSFDLHVAMWGILKAGAAYLLIDPSLPEDRINYMLSNANVVSVITDMYLNFDTINMNLLDGYKNTLPKVKSTNEDRFCVIYTSGSTGTPKGVELKRLGVINMVNGYIKQLNIEKCNVFLSTSTVAFDMFMAENFIPILIGKTIVLANENEQAIPNHTCKLISENKVDFILSTPSKISLLLTHKECLKDVKLIQLGGEVFKSNLYNELKKATNAKIYNSYGPCECTGCTTNKLVTSDTNVSIGSPICNVKLYIENHIGNILPLDVPGELVIKGDNVGLGYINKMSFDGTYKTGDIAMLSSNGDMIYCGRKDNQIKLHGLRIELDEITAKIVKIEGVKNAVTVIKKVNNIDCICSYVVCSDNALNDSDIKKKLANSLPGYMVPSHIIFVDSFNITLNGKIDTRSLPDIFIEQKEYIAPSTQTEVALEQIWSEILNISQISVNASFFELGGDSLCSIRLVSQVYSKFNVNIDIKDVFENPTISQLSKRIDSLGTSFNSTKIVNHGISDYYPVTSMQRGIYYTTQMEEGNISYNTPFSITFNKVPDVKKLEKALNSIINMHESFRTSFDVYDNDVVQKVASHIEFKLKVANQKNTNFITPFNLSCAPLIHAELDIFDNQAILLLDIHHIICDGTSIHLFAQELCDLYNEKNFEKSEYDYIDFAVNQKIENEDRLYWLSKFKDDVPMLNMPTEFERTNSKSNEGKNIYKEVTFTNKINLICKELQITPFMFFLSCYYILLYKYTMQNDIIVGTPVDCRNSNEFYNVIGMFVNTICLRQDIRSNNSFREFASMVKDNCVNSFAHQAYPFDELVKELEIPRVTGRNPLFDVLFVYESQGMPKLEFNNIEVDVNPIVNPTSKFDFSLEVTPYKSSYGLRLEYSSKLYSQKFMDDFLSAYINVIDVVVENIDIHISKIQILNGETNLINQSLLNYPEDTRIIDLFEKQVSTTPDNVALVFEDTSYTYKELNEKVTKLANYISNLPTYKKIMKQDHKVIGILMNRRAEIIISMLAILKVGAGYLPIDPTYPEERINYIINDSGVSIVLSEKGIKTKVSTVFVDDETIYNNGMINSSTFKNKKANDIAYMIYTSGSTGTPKGVMVKESNVVNFIYSMKNILPLEDKTIVSVTTMCFDIFVVESLLPVCCGFKIVFANNEEQNNPLLLNKLCITHNVDFISTTPSKFNLYISDDTEYIKRMKLILLSGEALPQKLLKRIQKITTSEIYDMYGPTETTVFSTYKRLTNSSKVVIGAPIDNTSMYILDNDMNKLPQNVPGRLFIGGKGVSLGYINKPELTSEKFIKYNNEVVYDTGDLAKVNSKGEIEYLGRADFQIKMHGLRIELGEIENRMSSYPGIIDSIVTIKTVNDRDILCGYFVADSRITISLLRDRLAKKLPSYMVPSYLVQLDSFEHTPNGKIDRKKLPEPLFNSKKIIEPRTSTEKKLLVIWKSLLSINKISINDNFFEIGGDSLSALRLQLELMKIGFNITYSDIFNNSTIESLAEIIDKSNVSHSLVLYKKRNLWVANKALRKNSIRHKIKLKQQELKNVLLVGATGFLGIHVLAELLKEDNIKVYCIVRDDPSTSAEHKLRNKFKYYFNTDLSNLFGSRLFVISGDISKQCFGLSYDQYRHLSSNIHQVVNCAAIVKHYGKYEDFEKVNVIGVKNIVDFCEEFGKTLFHTSTVSVSGNTIVDLPTSFNPDKKVYFSEKNLFINQSLDNVYVRSKFEAEKFILEELANKKLRGIILRIGNITNRYYDGKFQENSSENAFINRLKAFIYLKEIPKSILNNYIEFSPVDSVSQSIIKTMKYYTKSISVLHLYNSNHLCIKDLILYLNELGIKMTAVDDKVFKKSLKESLFNSSSPDNTSVLLNDLDDNNNLVYKTNLITTNEFTLKFLSLTGFYWPRITKDYIKRVIDNLY